MFTEGFIFLHIAVVVGLRVYALHRVFGGGWLIAELGRWPLWANNGTESRGPPPLSVSSVYICQGVEFSFLIYL